MDSMSTSALDEIREAAEGLATEAADAAAGEEVVVSAEVAALAAIIAAVRPALPVLTAGRRGKIWSVYADTGGRNGCNPVSIRRAHPGRGCLVVDGYRRRCDGTGNRGTIGGHRLYLASDGFIEATLSGEWSSWSGEWDRYETEISNPSLAAIAAEYDLGDIVAGLWAAISAAREDIADMGVRQKSRLETATAIVAAVNDARPR